MWAADASPLLPALPGRTVLVVDDEALIRWAVRERLSQLGYAVLEAATGEEAYGVCRSRRVDLVLLDLKLPDADGLELLGRLRADHAAGRAILMTAYGTPDVAEKAASLGVLAIGKPFDLDGVANLVASEIAVP